LFAGVTLITHGRDGHLWGFVNTAADYITKRVGGPAQAPRYILTLTPDAGDGHLVPSLTHVNGTGTPQNSTSGEIILLIDWTSVDKNVDYQLHTIADVVTGFMLNTPVDGINLTQLPLHELSLSRGTGLMDEIAKSLARSGVWVDQETYADPNPVEQMGDSPPAIYDNVAFVDNYWRTDFNPDNFSTNGMPVDGAYNLQVQWLDQHITGWAMAHIVPAGWYNGTIDTTATNGGEGPIYDDWYGTTPDKPARDQTGFIYSRIVGADRPASGVWAASGGTGSRIATEHSGPQWPNITDLALTAGTAVPVGQPVQMTYIHQDRDSDNTITFYLDTDRNPYNNNFAKTLGTASFSASDSIDQGQTAGDTTGVAAGRYWLAAVIVDPDGHSRYSYGKLITVGKPTTPPPDTNPPPDNPPPDPTPDPGPGPLPLGAKVRLVSGVLRINGLASDDNIRISGSPGSSTRLVALVNGARYTFVKSQVKKIIAYGGDGNDYIGISQRYGKISTRTRFYGGNGMDRLVGASGSDTLSGGGENDRIYAGLGNDSIMGGDGTDRMWGQGGKDVFAGYKTIEIMDRTDIDVLKNK
jgi:hypothetical protein